MPRTRPLLNAARRGTPSDLRGGPSGRQPFTSHGAPDCAEFPDHGRTARRGLPAQFPLAMTRNKWPEVLFGPDADRGEPPLPGGGTSGNRAETVEPGRPRGTYRAVDDLSTRSHCAGIGPRITRRSPGGACRRAVTVYRPDARDAHGCLCA